MIRNITLRRPDQTRSASSTPRLAVLATLAGAALALAACGQDGSSTPSDKAPAAPAGQALDTRNVKDVGDVLTDTAGHTLYIADSESATAIRCTGDCLKIWAPVTVGDGLAPKRAEGMTEDPTTVQRPEGTTQVAYQGKPLYTFVPERGAGQAAGHGVTDSFNGVMFTWHAATVSGPASGGSGDTGGGGYGY